MRCPLIVNSCREFAAGTPGGSQRGPYRVNCCNPPLVSELSWELPEVSPAFL